MEEAAKEERNFIVFAFDDEDCPILEMVDAKGPKDAAGQALRIFETADHVFVFEAARGARYRRTFTVEKA